MQLRLCAKLKADASHEDARPPRKGRIQVSFLRYAILSSEHPRKTHAKVCSQSEWGFALPRVRGLQRNDDSVNICIRVCDQKKSLPHLEQEVFGNDLEKFFS